MYFTSQRFYRIDYEWGKIVAIIAATTVAFICYKLIGPAPLDFAGELIKIGLILGFVGSLPLLGVVKKSDLESVRRAVLEKLNRS